MSYSRTYRNSNGIAMNRTNINGSQRGREMDRTNIYGSQRGNETGEGSGAELDQVNPRQTEEPSRQERQVWIRNQLNLITLNIARRSPLLMCVFATLLAAFSELKIKILFSEYSLIGEAGIPCSDRMKGNGLICWKVSVLLNLHLLILIVYKLCYRVKTFFSPG